MFSKYEQVIDVPNHIMLILIYISVWGSFSILGKKKKLKLKQQL